MKKFANTVIIETINLKKIEKNERQKKENIISLLSEDLIY